MDEIKLWGNVRFSGRKKNKNVHYSIFIQKCTFIYQKEEEIA